MYNAKVYNIMVGGPSDVTEAAKIAIRSIYKWNDTNSEKEHVVVLPIYWSKDAFPMLGAHPQKILNKQLVDKSDLLICIFAGRIGSETDEHISGTVEEIEKHRQAGKAVAPFFIDSISTASTSPEQYAKVYQLKENLMKRGYVEICSDLHDFERKFDDLLSKIVNAVFIQHNSFSSVISNLSDEDLGNLKTWVETDDETAHYIGMENGSYILFLGSKDIQLAGGKDKAKWEAFFNRLIEGGYVKSVPSKNKYPAYELTDKAYSLFD